MAGRVENLKPWKPGESGNPGGRPKRDMAAEIAQAIFEQDPDAIRQIFAAALKKGDPRVFTVLAERAYGKARQFVELGGEMGNSVLTVRFVRSEDTQEGQ